MRVLCGGDLHIGRRSSKIPPELDGPAFSSAAAWDAIVDRAVGEQVDLVALSGDLVDRANRYFEALGPLERGLRRLSEVGIPVYAVAGNHDFDVLPRLVDSLDVAGFRLIGRGGQWERVTATGRDGEQLHIDGWSFPREHVTENPLDSYRGVDDGVAVLGLLHADLDQPSSTYGPVALAELQRQPVALWLLGHIHRSREHRHGNGPVVLYPGTPQALDPSEAGVHGAWLAEIEPRRIELRHVPISTVEYHSLTVDLTGVDTSEAFQQQLGAALRGAHQQASTSVRCRCCRLTLVGRTRLHRTLRGLVESQLEDLALSTAGATTVLEAVQYETRPALELASIAARNDPPGEVARLIQALEQPEMAEEYHQLVTGATERLRSIHRSSFFAEIAADPDPTADAARALVLSEAWSLLDALVAQREEA